MRYRRGRPTTQVAGDRFDIVWSFALDRGTGTYAFEQIPQLLFAGDVADPIAHDVRW